MSSQRIHDARAAALRSLVTTSSVHAITILNHRFMLSLFRVILRQAASTSTAILCVGDSFAMRAWPSFELVLSVRCAEDLFVPGLTAR